jgi:hypothetical protein
VYGVPCVYPVCDSAKTFCALCGTKTLTQHMVVNIKKLGYQIEVKQAISSL